MLHSLELLFLPFLITKAATRYFTVFTDEHALTSTLRAWLGEASAECFLSLAKTEALCDKSFSVFFMTNLSVVIKHHAYIQHKCRSRVNNTSSVHFASSWRNVTIFSQTSSPVLLPLFCVKVTFMELGVLGGGFWSCTGLTELWFCSEKISVQNDAY